MEAAKEYR